MTNKLIKRRSTLVDLLVVAQALPDDEKKQIQAFGGSIVPEEIAISLYNGARFMWTLAEEETQEPLAVGGFVQTGTVTFRSFFLANDRLWAEHGSAATKLVAETLDEVKEQFPVVRLETYCLPEREKARAWYEKLGLTFEAELACFGVKGDNAVVYSTVKRPSSIQLATVDGLKAQGIKVN